MYYKVPFITFGCKGIYEELSKLGFDTYEKYIDISYNTKDKMYDRVKGCYDVMNSIKQLPHDEYTQLIESMNDSVEHNYNQLVSSNFRNNSNNNFFDEVVNVCC